MLPFIALKNVPGTLTDESPNWFECVQVAVSRS
jgi:hypothetical protein